MSLTQITQAINANNASAGGSMLVDRGQQGFVVRGVGLIGSLDDLGKRCRHRAKGGVPVLVRDLGEVQAGQPASVAASSARTTTPDTIEGIVLLLKGREPIASCSTACMPQSRELNDHLLPRDVRIVPYLDRATLVGRRCTPSAAPSPRACCW